MHSFIYTCILSSFSLTPGPLTFTVFCTIVAEVKLVYESLHRIENRLCNLSLDNSSISGTDAQHGEMIKLNLIDVGSYHEVERTDGEAILPEHILTQGLELLADRQKEDALVALYTPVFQSILCGVNDKHQRQLELVNSECFTWFHVAGTSHKKDMKPDLFITSRENVLYKDAYANAPACTSERAFGIFGNWKCRDSLNSIWDAKTALNDEGMGKVFRYVQIAGQKFRDYKGEHVPIRGVAFDAERMMLIYGLDNVIQKVVVLRMAEGGSRQYLVNFLSQRCDVWADAVRASCMEFGVSLGEIEIDSPILLGAGGYGRAYRLERGGALKISMGRAMFGEYGHMHTAHEKCPDIVVSPQRYYQKNGEDGKVLFSAYLMADCGKPVASPISNAMQTLLATALGRLHKAGVFHGDPRVENIVKVGESLKWIDFFEGGNMIGDTNEAARDVDVRKLIRSVFGAVPDLSSPSPDVTSFLTAYNAALEAN